MSNFEKCLQFVLKEEGGFTDNPHDPGKSTNYGITQVTYDAWLRKQGLLSKPVLHITSGEVTTIYKQEYWDAHNLEPMPEVWQLFLFDSYVQHRPDAVRSFVAGNNSVADALWARIAYYTDLNNFLYFGRNWMRRMCHLRIALRAINGQV